MDLKIKLIKQITFEQFEEFLNSLDDEKKTWSLDLQGFKDYKNWFEHHQKGGIAIVLLDEDKIVSLINGYQDHKLTYLVELSFVVKKGYQGMGIGTHMLLEIEKYLSGHYKQLCAKHYKDNIASHKAFLKAGYKEAIDKNIKEENNLLWKIKEIK